ncbi:MAG: hypothetical protein ACE5I1_18720 [bacterium]
MSIYINLVIEDEVQLNILKRVLAYSNQPFVINSTLGLRGNDYIKRNLHAFNHAARFIPCLVLTDLDRTECAPLLVREWINFKRNPNLIFRIAVREAESWLLADRNNFASFLGVSHAKMERNTESIDNPKEYIVRIARKSRKRRIREALVPFGTATVGPNYNFALTEFILNKWKIEKAIENSQSLSRAIKSLNNFKIDEK